ncbi:MAG TPA: hypothetical protein VLA11_03850 [Woeseiaceae bacterium]|jgi:hypothetical protein|nr:hypothetical protein [Woeseiaceae bacterium]
MLQRIAAYIRNHDWFAVVVEIFVIMVGLMLALQLDRWREHHEELDLEHVYIQRLANDIATDVPDIGYAIGLQTMRLELVELLMNVADNPDAALERPVLFLGAVDQAAYTYTPTLTKHTFENLRTTGDMRLIRSVAVKEKLFEYYSYDEEQRQYRPLQFNTESRHFELAAGVLDRGQVTYIQDTFLFFRPTKLDELPVIDVDEFRIREAALRLSLKPDLIAWLPYIRSMQLEQIAVHEARLSRAHDALEVLRSYASEIAPPGE